MLLRYEDLIQDSNATIRAVYEFIGVPVPYQVIQFYDNALHSKKEGNSMTTHRKNVTVSASQWRRNLHPSVLAVIQAICSNTLQQLGYY